LNARCHLCGRSLTDLWARATDVEYGTTAQSFAYFQCERCEALSIDPLPADRLEEIYPPTYYSFASGENPLDPRRNAITRVKARLDERTFRRALALIGASPRAGRSTLEILDVGGGTGEVAAGLLRVTGPDARGTVVDFDPDSIAAARQRGLDGVIARFEEFETDRSFDLILMLNVIEHVADPAAMLRHARDLLSPTGLLWIQTPDYRSVDARLFRHRNWTGLHCPRHWVVFSADGLRRSIGEAGLDVVELRHTQAGSFWAGSILGATGIGRARANGTLPRPLVRHPLFMPLAAAGAAFDLVTARLRPTSQVVAFARAVR
jgi:2-polyprenyl-3-methyl-5-hydroxy-6-metoxy-1,4-benzoquinol methylase